MGWAGQWVRRCPGGLAAMSPQPPCTPLLARGSEPTLPGSLTRSGGLEAAICPRGDTELPQRPGSSQIPAPLKGRICGNASTTAHKHFCHRETPSIRILPFLGSCSGGELMPQRPRTDLGTGVPVLAGRRPDDQAGRQCVSWSVLAAVTKQPRLGGLSTNSGNVGLPVLETGRPRLGCQRG